MSPEIREAFENYSPENRTVLKAARAMILRAADDNPDIGLLTETLKWGEPAYLTQATKAGSTLRLGQTRQDSRPALFVNCHTTLVDQFRQLYPDTFDYRDNRALVIPAKLNGKADALIHCIALTLTYHKRKS